MKYLKKITLIIAFIIIYVITISYWMKFKAKDCIYDSVLDVPKNKVGLVLGASKLTSNGTINLYYKYRLEAVYQLYKSGKIQFILISGDNSRKEYDEPSDFKNDLILKGIPREKIFLDYAGFRTLDSIVRAKEVFGLNSVTIISQKFHNERAVYLSNHFNVNAIAFNAQDVRGRYGAKTRLREYLARTKASIDILFNVEPKFLGKKIEIK